MPACLLFTSGNPSGVAYDDAEVREAVRNLLAEMKDNQGNITAIYKEIAKS